MASHFGPARVIVIRADEVQPLPARPLCGGYGYGSHQTDCVSRPEICASQNGQLAAWVKIRNARRALGVD